MPLTSDESFMAHNLDITRVNFLYQSQQTSLKTATGAFWPLIHQFNRKERKQLVAILFTDVVRTLAKKSGP